MVAVVNGLDEALELAHGAAVDHQHEGHPHRVLHAGQAVVQLAGRLDLVGHSWGTMTLRTHVRGVLRTLCILLLVQLSTTVLNATATHKLKGQGVRRLHSGLI